MVNKYLPKKKNKEAQDVADEQRIHKPDEVDKIMAYAISIGLPHSYLEYVKAHK